MSAHEPVAIGERPMTLPELWTQVAASIGQPPTLAAGGACTFKLAAPAPDDLDADLCFAFDEGESAGLSIRVRFEQSTIVMEPGVGEPEATVHGAMRAFLDFFANRQSSQALFLEGEWRTGHNGGGRGPRDVDEIRSYVRALEQLLPAPYQLHDAMRARVRASADRIGDAFIVERRRDLTRAAFVEQFVRAGRPVILHEIVRDVSWWRFDRLRALFGEAWTHFSRYPDCSYAIGDCLDRITSGDPRAFKAALPVTRDVREHYGRVDEYLTDLGSSTATAEVFEKAQALLIAPADDRMPATYRATVWHRDWADNLLTQMIGVKRVRLASPVNEARFSLSTTPACHYNVAVDHSPIDPRRLGLLDGMTVREAVLEAGDALFIPCGWLHTVENLTASAAVNCWRIRPPEILSLKGDSRD